MSERSEVSEHEPVDYDSPEELAKESARARDAVRGNHLQRLERAMGPRIGQVPIRDDVREWAQHYIAGAPDNLILLGPTGTGKSAQAWAALRWIIEQDPEPWRNEPTWDGRKPQVDSSWLTVYFSELLASTRPSDDSEAFIGECKSVGVLVIDDCMPVATDWQAQQIKRVFEARWSFCRPTIITSNLTEQMLKDGLPDTVVSRLYHASTTIIMRGTNYRAAQ